MAQRLTASKRASCLAKAMQFRTVAGEIGMRRRNGAGVPSGGSAARFRARESSEARAGARLHASMSSLRQRSSRR